MSASYPNGRLDIAAPGQHGNSPLFPTSREEVAAMRMVIVESNRTKAELWQYYGLTSWNLNVVASYNTGREGLAVINRLQPEIIFAALRLCDLAPREYLRLLRAAAPSAKLVLFSSICNEYLVHTLHGANYQGFIYEPDESLASLTHMLQQIRGGERAISPTILQYQNRMRADPGAFPKLLSPRHEEVLICIAHAMSDDEIALQLGFSPATALSHRQKIMQKLNIHSTPKLIRYCTEKGFNSVPPPTPFRQIP